MFISFEGIDKSGKTTQVNLLAEFLQAKYCQVVVTKEPGGTQEGEKIKKIILEDCEISPLSELFLYLADRNQHVQQVIKPALGRQQVVICDRFADASVAYQGYARGISISLIQNLNKRVTEGIWPDVTFLLDIGPEKALLRAKKTDRIEKEKLSFHRKVREGYLNIARYDPNRVKVINADQKPTLIHEKIKGLICDHSGNLKR